MIYKARLAAMGEMVENIAHQWRQPLSSLALINSNIQDIIRFGEVDEGDLDKLFSKTKRVIKNMSKTIDDFRYFFKPKEKQEPFMVNNCIHSALDFCEERLKHHKIEIHLEEKSQLTIVGYPNQLSQVILNLINNAIDSLIENRRENLLIKIKIDDVSGIGKIEIYDNGGGVEDENLNKIFEPYFTTKDFKKGTGLGLYMARMIVEKNFRGAISAQNEADGIVFSISIPLEGADSYE